MDELNPDYFLQKLNFQLNLCIYYETIPNIVISYNDVSLVVWKYGPWPGLKYIWKKKWNDDDAEQHPSR